MGDHLERKKSRVPIERPPVVHVECRPVADQTPKGTKRHHHNFRAPAEESTFIDFGALCSELKVRACFPDLNEELVRAVLVYGLLQT